MANLDYKAKNGSTGEWLYGIPVLNKMNIINKYNDVISHCICQIEPDTISQFTGLRDKNGTKIYQNEIFIFKKSNKELIYLVVWMEEKACYGYKSMNTNREIPFARFDELQEDFLNYCEVIGNKFDNSEYLN